MSSRLDGGYDPDYLMLNHRMQMDEYWNSCGHPANLHCDPDPHQLTQYSSLRDAVPSNLIAAATPPASEVSLSWEPLACRQYETTLGRGNGAKHGNVIHFNRLIGGVLLEGVLLADLLEKRNLLDLVNGDGAGLPDDVAAKISIRIEFPGYNAYSRKINARRSTSTGEPISLINLAHKIAQEMSKFMARHCMALADWFTINTLFAGDHNKH
ncbi:hypothetical protein C8Q74DRAFT_1222128 [Fomes fomentarius]|nr:hypothetical protein C8Q74DRAFT_1222128 [Fomes fomentarius]